jgi:hypothetical protein
MINEQYFDLIRETDEQILWSGCPSPNRTALIHWKQPLIGLIVILVNAELINSIRVTFPLAVFVFGGIALVLILWPFFYYFKSTKTRYFITNHRVVIHSILPRQEFTIIRPTELSPIVIKPHKDGTASLVISRKPLEDDEGKIHYYETTLVGLKDWREIETLLSQTFKQSSLSETAITPTA